LPAYGFAQASFYQGKTITLVRGVDPGGLAEMRTRALIPSLQKHIAGNPTIIMEFMPGGGGRKAANHLFSVARPDGLTIGNAGSGLLYSALLGLPGIMYEIDKFSFLGSEFSESSYVFITKKELDSIEKLQNTPGIRIGAHSVGHVVYAYVRFFAWILGLKDPKFVTGYSSPQMDVALTSGELDARTNALQSVIQRKPDWVEKGIMRFHTVIEVPRGARLRHPAFDRLPELETFARSETEKKVLATFRDSIGIGAPYIVPPGTPRERVESLREGFRKALQDPEFLQRFKKMTGDDASPLLPEEQEKMVRGVATDPQTVQLFKQLAGGNPLPPR
jgi:tripartite-type tricarboxylate transporter receptor subunit TctC